MSFLRKTHIFYDVTMLWIPACAGMTLLTACAHQNEAHRMMTWLTSPFPTKRYYSKNDKALGGGSSENWSLAAGQFNSPTFAGVSLPRFLHQVRFHRLAPHMKGIPQCTGTASHVP